MSYIYIDAAMNFQKDNLKYNFCSSYCPTLAVKLVIRGKKMFFLRKSQPLRGHNLVGVSSVGCGKQTILKPDADGGYNLSMLEHKNQVITLSRYIPDTDYYASYIRVPISYYNGSRICFHNTPSLIYNTDKLRRFPTDKAHLQYWLKATDYFQSNEKPIKNMAEKLASKCSWDDYIKVMLVHEYVARYLFYDYDELQSDVRQDNSAMAVLKRRHTTCRGYVSLCVSLLRAMGIPAQQIPCYVARPGQMIDINNVTPKTNHVFVAAYADNRWILLDPTRDGHNKYKDGNFIDSKEQASYANFDMTEQFFSFTHWLP